jgi:chromosome segregation ATPase
MDLHKRREQLTKNLENAQKQYEQTGKVIEQLKGAIAIIDEQLSSSENEETEEETEE